MNPHFEQLVLQASGARAIRAQQPVQTLWSGYGEILRLSLDGAATPTAILKYIVLPEAMRHPRGWHGQRSHARKLRSYEVEMHWYRDWSARCDDHCRVARCLATESTQREHAILLEDLDGAGVARRVTQPQMHELHACLDWLAAFHGRFLGAAPEGLWPIGSYWHLATRPDELAAMADGALKRAAADIDRRLNQCQYQTLIHGDAKLANFCFNADGDRVAAVDFQYVGGGCGMKDVAYFLGSCLGEEACRRHESALLDYYFDCLRAALARHAHPIEPDVLEREWRALYPLAWADFHRFLLGWAPQHRKLNDYSAQMVARALAGPAP